MIKLKQYGQVLLASVILLLHISQAIAAKPDKPKKIAPETISSENFSYQITPPPLFVERSDAAPSEDKAGKNLGDVLFVLLDRQVSLTNETPEEYVRFESKPLTAAALQELSQVYLTFNPAYQKLFLHSIRIWRDGRSIDLTHTVKLDLMRRENNLEKNMYEGNVTAVGVLPDTRVNDVIDLEYSISGTNPIFGNRFADVYSMTQPAPVEHYRLSFLTPANRPIKVMPPQGIQVKEVNDKGLIRYTVENENIKPVRFEDKMPDWHQPRQTVQVSEYQDWGQVAVWANNLFKVDDTLSPELNNQIQIWKNSNLTKEQLAVEVLRWVQTHVRYFGIELGVNSHLPAPPNQTAERKFGDCKDKSLLLATLLKALGVDAHPTLASLALRRNTESMIPSPAVFDHAIVKVIIAGHSYWLDPTQPAQFGNIDKLGVTDFGGVLVLGEKTDRLESASYPSNYDNFYQKVDHFKVLSFTQPVLLTTQIKASFTTAENIRNAHESQSKEEFKKDFESILLRLYPKTKFDEDIDFTDDKTNNQVTVTLKGSIKEFFQYKPSNFTSTFYAYESLAGTTLPNTTQRSTPFALPSHSRMTETVEFEFPENSLIKPIKNESTKAGEFWTFSSNSDLKPKKLTQTWSLKANKEAVPPSKIGEFTTESKGIRDLMGMTFKLPVGFLTDSDKLKIQNSLRRLDRAYGNSTSPRVAAEVKDAINLVVITKDLASGKLADKQLAEAYKLRSQAYDDRGDVQHALEDIIAARKLEPDNVEYLTSEADTLMGDGQFEKANLLYEEAITKGKSSGINTASTYKSYGVSLHYSDQNEKATEVLDEGLRQDSGQDSLYTAIWRYIISAKTPESSALLLSSMGNIQDRSWPYPVGEMLLGKISPEQLISAAGSQDKGLKQDQFCEAYFYIGEKYLVENNKEKAKENFQKSIDQEVLPFAETNFSLHELGKKKGPKKDSFFDVFQ